MPADTFRSMHLSLHIHKTPAVMAERAAHLLAEVCQEAVAERGVFRLAISGGSTPIPLFRLLASKDWAEHLPWDKIALFWVDERCVAPDHPESNYGMAKRELLAHVSATRWARMRGELAPEEAALLYEEQIRKEFALEPGALPRFDLILLGMGNDGHTASLFPDSPGLAEKERLVVDQYVPSRKSNRITLTLPVLNNARCCLFMVQGKEKHPVLSRVLNLLEEPVLPAQLVRPAVGDLVWIVDEAAARG